MRVTDLSLPLATCTGLGFGRNPLFPTRLADRLVITAAAAFEGVQPWAEKHPPISLWSWKT
jgi:hypothetical protein